MHRRSAPPITKTPGHRPGLRRRPADRLRHLHPQHHRFPEPAGRLPAAWTAGPPARSSTSTSSTTPTFFRGRTSRTAASVAAPTLAATVTGSARKACRRRASAGRPHGPSNVTGEILPIRALAALAHQYGARIVVDAGEAGPHGESISPRTTSITSPSRGHKLYAPFGAGVLVGRTDWLDAGTPHLAGGGAVRDARLDSVSWTTGPPGTRAARPTSLARPHWPAPPRPLRSWTRRNGTPMRKESGPS